MKPRSYDLAPICASENRCHPLPCCNACVVCMKADYYQALKDKQDAERTLAECREFFGGDLDGN